MGLSQRLRGLKQRALVVSGAAPALTSPWQRSILNHCSVESSRGKARIDVVAPSYLWILLVIFFKKIAKGLPQSFIKRKKR
jgi:hypothetical protein